MPHKFSILYAISKVFSCFFLIFFSLVCTLSALPQPQAPEFLGDINGEFRSAYVEYLTAFGDNLLFVRRTDEHGKELWISDGTEAGTSLLKDINPGESSSSPEYFTRVVTSKGERVFFAAQNAEFGEELWVTDGTSSGTVLVKDIREGSTGSNVREFFYAPDAEALVFSANDGENGQELWVSDGTPDGTKILADIYDGSGNGFPRYFTQTPDGIAFSARTESAVAAYDEELWLLESDLGGIAKVADLNDTNLGSRPSFLVWNDELKLLFYSCAIDSIGTELCISDLTESGTKLVKDIRTGSSSSTPSELTNLNDQVIFLANDGTAGQEIWRTDGTEAGTVLVKDIEPGLSDSNAEYLTQVGANVFFAARVSGFGTELWKTDGTAANTLLVKDIATGIHFSRPTSLTEFNGILYFYARSLEEGAELWRSDGTMVGTTLVSDINPYGDSSPEWLVATDEMLYFFAESPHNILFKMSKAEEISPLGDITNPGSIGSSPIPVKSFGDIVFFVATTGALGDELWVSSNNNPPKLLKDICKEDCDGVDDEDTRFVTANGKYFFNANDEEHGEELWVTDGTTAGTMLFRDFKVGSSSGRPEGLTQLGDSFVFTVETDSGNEEPWISDGTLAGTTLLKDIVPGDDDSSPYEFTAFGNTVLFVADNDTNGSELWKTDGTTAGTVMVKDIFPGDEGSYPEYLTRVGDKVFFVADNGTTGYELWVTDGTTAGTQLTKDINPGEDNTDIYLIFPAGDYAVFLAYEPSTGEELWTSDGTSVGTKLLGDFTPGPDSSDIYSDTFCALGSKVIFSFSTEQYGDEPWITDGTSAGTKIVKDIGPIGEDSTPETLGAYEDTCFFVGTDSESNYRMWQTDGTAAGTVLVPLAADEAEPYTERFLFANGYAYFASESPLYGEEPYFMLVDECPENPDKLEAGACGCGLPDVDSDGDGLLDCNDSCPMDSLKETAGICGCGESDIDSDGDGTVNCQDSCPDDGEKIEVGVCGCGTTDSDVNANSTVDCLFTEEFSSRILLLQDAVNRLKPLKRDAKRKKKRLAKQRRTVAKNTLTSTLDYYGANSLGIEASEGSDIQNLLTLMSKTVRKSLKIKSKKFKKFKRQAKRRVGELLNGVAAS